MRDPYSEALIHATLAAISFLCAFPLGPWMFYVSGAFAVVAAGYLVYAISRGI